MTYDEQAQQVQQLDISCATLRDKWGEVSEARIKLEDAVRVVCRLCASMGSDWAPIELVSLRAEEERLHDEYAKMKQVSRAAWSALEKRHIMHFENPTPDELIENTPLEIADFMVYARGQMAEVGSFPVTVFPRGQYIRWMHGADLGASDHDGDTVRRGWIRAYDSFGLLTPKGMAVAEVFADVRGIAAK